MAAIFFEKEAAKKHKFFIFLKDCYFVMGGRIDMMLRVFRDTCGLSKKCGFATFPKI